ncbi:hypothetical protein BASA81_009977 [Batrachochytrium salamandrivorans]|nr:hypothetical protein BASA81_009977 [Batrachochytrium salamandrivorans]
MSNLKEIVASLTDRLRSLELENQTLQQVIISLTPVNPRLPSQKSSTALADTSGFMNQLELVFQLQDQRLHRPQEDRHSWNPKRTKLWPASTTDDMDVDFARRGPLTPVERQRRMSPKACLVWANRAILRPLAPSQTLALAPSAMSKRLRWRTLTLRCRETTSADFKWRLRLGREPRL